MFSLVSTTAPSLTCSLSSYEWLIVALPAPLLSLSLSLAIARSSYRMVNCCIACAIALSLTLSHTLALTPLIPLWAMRGGAQIQQPYCVKEINESLSSSPSHFLVIIYFNSVNSPLYRHWGFVDAYVGCAVPSIGHIQPSSQHCITSTPLFHLSLSHLFLPP